MAISSAHLTIIATHVDIGEDSAAAAKLLQLRLTLSDPMDCSPPGSSIHGIFQARILEWGAIAFSGEDTRWDDLRAKFLTQCFLV